MALNLLDLKAFGERIAARDPDRQTAEIHIRIALMNRFSALGTAIIMSPRDEGTLAGLTATDDQPLTAPRQISDLPMFTTTAIPTDGGTGTDESTIFMGDFRHLYLGVRTEIRVEILREAFAENHQYGFVCHMRGDIGVAHAGAFHTTTAVQG